MSNILLTTILISPIVLATIGLFLSRGFSLKWINQDRLVKTVSYFGLITSVISAYWVFTNGLIESQTIGYQGLGFSIRLDRLNIIMLVMISIISLVVFRYSRNYLDGDPNQTRFIGKLAITVSFIQVFVISGNIALLLLCWTGTSIALQKLLAFYRERERARTAARKKFFVARLGDILLISAMALFYLEFGTGNMEVIFSKSNELIGEDLPVRLTLASVLLVAAAGLKAVQLPFHSWILEVMETPTPVSALLHAGLINAGPFLVIRFSPIVDQSQYALLALLCMGAISALYGTLISPSQPAVKTSLAYSTIAHMGFSFMISGLGVYSASLLHLVAHSFYKAHSFLASGSIIDRVRRDRVVKHRRRYDIKRVILGFVGALLLFIGSAEIWEGLYNLEYQLIIISGIICIGIVSLSINAIDSDNNSEAVIKVILAAGLVVLVFFTLEEIMRYALAGQIPELSEPTEMIKFVSAVILLIFSIVVLITTLIPNLTRTRLFIVTEVHLRNGLYINVLTDRIFGSLRKIKANKV